MNADSRERGLFLFVRGGELPIYYTDWREIISRVPKFDPNIRVKMFTELHPNPKQLKTFANIPTLAVVLYDHIPPLPRGRVIRNQVVSKLDQLKAYKRAGLPFPSASLFRWGMKLDTKVFGEFVVLKPLDHRVSSQGHVELWKTENVSMLNPSDFPDEHPIRHYNYLVQKYIHTGDHPTSYRVLTFLHSPMYGLELKLKANKGQPSVDGTVVASTEGLNRWRKLTSDKTLIDLSLKASMAIPYIPTQGIDIIKEDHSNKYFILESNCGGNVWHISSRIGEKLRKTKGCDRNTLLAQFDCWNSAAKSLVSATKFLAT